VPSATLVCTIGMVASSLTPFF